MSEDESVRPEHATPPTPEAAPLLVQARGLEMAGRESMVFGPLDFDIPQGNIGVLTGQQGSGRSALLLALSGRLKGVKGHLPGYLNYLDGVHIDVFRDWKAAPPAR